MRLTIGHAHGQNYINSDISSCLRLMDLLTFIKYKHVMYFVLLSVSVCLFVKTCSDEHVVIIKVNNSFFCHHSFLFCHYFVHYAQLL